MNYIINNRLVLTEEQKCIFNSLFFGLEEVYELIEQYKSPLQSSEEISIFILINKLKFYTLLGEKAWNEKSEELKSLVREIASGEKSACIVLPGNTSITKQHHIYIPIKGILEVKTSNESSIFTYKKKIEQVVKNPKYSFGLLKDSGGFYIRIKCGEELKGIHLFSLKSLFWSYTKKIKLLGSHSKTDYSRIEGHAVSGGLPSLGKKK